MKDRDDAARTEALRSSDTVMARLIDQLEPIDLATWRANRSLATAHLYSSLRSR